jgi:hypothetical protein
MAASNCARKNLSLISINSTQEWQCLLNANSGNETIFIIAGKKILKCGNAALRATGASFWTSGSNEGEYCNTLNVYSWCSLNGTLMKPEFLALGGGASYWKNTAATNPADERCLIYSLNSTSSETTGLEHASCNASNYYICEVKSLYGKFNS